MEAPQAKGAADDSSARIKTAVRVRPFNERELAQAEYRCIVSMRQNTTSVTNPVAFEEDAAGVGGSAVDEAMWRTSFAFDHSYWSHDPSCEHFASQEKVYEDMGAFILENAWAGFNCSICAYGQTGSGKSYTMMGPGSTLSTDREQWGLIPRICYGLFDNMRDAAQQQGGAVRYKVECSYLEIYNERARDLFAPSRQPTHGVGSAGLRVRSHPRTGVYVEDLKVGAGPPNLDGGGPAQNLDRGGRPTAPQLRRLLVIT